MSIKVNIFNPEWVDMVFEGKNQKYGAFILRKDSSKRHMVALVISSILFIAGIAGPGLIKSIFPAKKVEQDLTVRTLTNLDLDKPNEADKVIEITPPPPPVRNTIKFTPPVIKPDEEVYDEDVMKTQQQVVETTGAVGSVDFDKGTDDEEAPVATTENLTEETEEAYVIVEQMPEFPGGNEELMSFISKNLVYPRIAQENGDEGAVYINFVIDKAGKVSKITVVRSVSAVCDAEAVRVVKSMPAWKPGRQGGRAVSVSYTLPIKFKLQ
jgi:protein TonB